MELSVQLRYGSPVPVVAVGGELDVESGLYLAAGCGGCCRPAARCWLSIWPACGSSTVPG